MVEPPLQHPPARDPASMARRRSARDTHRDGLQVPGVRSLLVCENEQPRSKSELLPALLASRSLRPALGEFNLAFGERPIVVLIVGGFGGSDLRNRNRIHAVGNAL